MAKKKATRTTRDKSFNYSQDAESGTISSLLSYNATKDFKNIRLLDLEDGIKVSGAIIINHASNNTTLKEMGYDVTIKTNDLASDENYRIYGAPFQVVLNNRQHYNNCGVESTLNTLAMAGIINMKEDLSNQKKIETSFLKTVWNLGIVEDSGVIGKLDDSDGGTEPDDSKAILSQFGIDSQTYYTTSSSDDTQFSDLNELGYKISQGYGAIIEVCSDKLWGNSGKSESGEEINIDHAVAITGVVYADNVDPSELNNDGTYKNAPVGFYIHDTGGWMTRYISLEEFKEVTLYEYHGMNQEDESKYYNYDDEASYNADYYTSNLRNYDSELKKYIGKQPNGIFAIITTEPIKSEMFNLNATGDKSDNIIWGNSGDNVIKGMAGNDILYGNAGDDEIRGGKGNDIIIGNNVSSTDLANFKNYLTETDSSRLGNIDTSGTSQTGSNLIYGDDGNDIIIGGNEADLIYGGKGNDSIRTGNGRNAVYAGAGNDLVIGGNDSDRLFGDAGNDVIYGGRGNDTINGGAGNDIIYGGSGNDRIETGKGNDTIYFEGKEYGIDIVSSQGGTTYFKFIDEKIENETISEGVKILDMSFELYQNDENEKQYDFGISFGNNKYDMTDGVEFNELFNSKSGKAKSLYIEDAEGEIYKVSVTKSAKATVGNSKDTRTTSIVVDNQTKKIDNEKINNIFFATRDKGTTITTSSKNDIVTMVQTDEYNISSLIADNNGDAIVYDEITYTGGDDTYISEERNTIYYVNNFGKDTKLSIYDNVETIAKTYKEKEDEEAKTIQYVSTDDRLYFSSDSSLNFFFDVGVNENEAITTQNTGLFIFSNDTQTNYTSIADGETLNGGFVYMDSFLEENHKFSEEGFYGNGQIEHFYTGETEYSYDFATIAQNVASWLSKTSYTSAFEALSDKETTANISELIACYTGSNTNS